MRSHLLFLVAVLAACDPVPADTDLDDGTGSDVVNRAPEPADFSRSAIGNTARVVSAAEGLLVGAYDPDGDALSVVPGTLDTEGGGTVELFADGGFTYYPPVGLTDAEDHLVYELTDGFVTVDANATFSLAERVWYVQNDATVPGDGRSHAPFPTLAEAASASGPGDWLYVSAGDASDAGQDEGIALQPGQRLIGAGVDLEVAGELLAPASSAPTISNAAGVGVQAHADVEIAGLIIADTLGDGIAGVEHGEVLVRDVLIERAGDDAVDVEGATVVRVERVTIADSAASGVEVQTVDEVVVRDVSVAHPGADGINIDDALVSATVSQVTVSDVGNGSDGIDVDNFIQGDGVQVSVEDCVVTGAPDFSTTSNGVDVDYELPLGQLRLTIERSRFEGVQEGIDARLINTSGAGTSGSSLVVVRDNTVGAVQVEGIKLSTFDDAVARVEVMGNALDCGAQDALTRDMDGFDVESRDRSAMTLVVQDNSVTGVEDTGIEVGAEEQSSMVARIVGNTVGDPLGFSGTGHDGIELYVYAQGSLAAVVEGNTQRGANFFDRRDGILPYYRGIDVYHTQPLEPRAAVGAEVRVVLANNDAGDGAQLRSEVGNLFELGGDLFVGDTLFDGDGGNLEAAGNNTHGGPLDLVVAGSVVVVDPSTIPAP